MPDSPRAFRRLLRHLLLALLLLTAQHAAALHALGHSVERPDGGQPAQQLHAGCLGLHGIDDAPVVHHLPAATSADRPEPGPQARPSRYTAPHHRPYLSRAPPVNS